MDIPRGKANALVNRDEGRISREAYDLYCFLLDHPTISQVPHRLKDILRAAVNGTPFGFIFEGLVSKAAASAIDERIANSEADPCVGLERDHLFTWKETSEFLLAHPRMEFEQFWAELKRRNQVALLLRPEHKRVSALQRMGHGVQSYALADIELVRVDIRAIKLAGVKAALANAHWPLVDSRETVLLEHVFSDRSKSVYPLVRSEKPTNGLG